MATLEKIIKIAVFDNVDLSALKEPLRALPEHIRIQLDVIKESYGKGEDKQRELAKLMKGYDGAVFRSSTYFTEEALKELPHLKFLGRAGVGVDNIAIEEASRNNTIVFYAPASNSTAVEELVYAQLSEFERKVGEQNSKLKAGYSEKKVKKVYAQGRELDGKTISVIGIGNIGPKIVPPGLGHGMKFKVYDAFKSPEDISSLVRKELEERGLVLSDKSRVRVAESLDKALSASDYITIHVPLDDSTRALIGKEQIAKMKDDAVLINNSREGIVDEFAVKGALDSKKLRAYITDVLSPNSPLLKYQNVFVTAHTGASTIEAQSKAAEMIGESIKAFLGEGKVLRSYNFPTIDDKVKDFYNLTRIIAAFATKYITYNNGKIKYVKVLASGLPSYNDRALSMGASAGTAFSLDKLGNGDLPAKGILKDEGIVVDAEQIEGARPGVSSRITVEYRLKSGEKIDFTGHIDPEAEQIRRYSITRIGNFKGRGTELYNVQYILAEHPDEPGKIGTTTTAIGKYGLNIERGQMNMGSKDNGEKNLAVYPVLKKDKPDFDVPPKLVGEIKNGLGQSGKVTYIDLRKYPIPYLK